MRVWGISITIIINLPELYVSDGIAYLSRNEDYDGEWMRGDDVELSDNPDSVKWRISSRLESECIDVCCAKTLKPQ